MTQKHDGTIDVNFDCDNYWARTKKVSRQYGSCPHRVYGVVSPSYCFHVEFDCMQQCSCLKFRDGYTCVLKNLKLASKIYRVVTAPWLTFNNSIATIVVTEGVFWYGIYLIVYDTRVKQLERVSKTSKEASRIQSLQITGNSGIWKSQIDQNVEAIKKCLTSYADPTSKV